MSNAVKSILSIILIIVDVLVPAYNWRDTKIRNDLCVCKASITRVSQGALKASNC